VASEIKRSVASEIKRSVESQISNLNLKSSEAWKPFLYPRSCRREAAEIIMD
jgi:hypothetical protein